MLVLVQTYKCSLTTTRLPIQIIDHRNNKLTLDISKFLSTTSEAESPFINNSDTCFMNSEFKTAILLLFSLLLGKPNLGPLVVVATGESK